MQVDERNFAKGSTLARRTYELSGDIANSDDQALMDSIVPGFAFKIVGVQHMVAAINAVADYHLRIGSGAAVLSGRAAPAAGTADGGNTGDGTMAVDAVGASAKVGTYTFTCTAAATDGGTFEMTDPDGTVIASDVEVGSAHTGSGHLDTTISDGATDFEVGDIFTVVVRAAEVPTALTRGDASLSATASDIVGTASDAIELRGHDGDGSGDMTNLRVRVEVEPTTLRGI